MNSPQQLTFAQLMDLARRAAQAYAPCACASAEPAGWESLSLSFPVTKLQEEGTLLADPYAEASYAEYHPDGTQYWSPQAPIAPRYFPYNRCSVWTCIECGRAYLRYTEAGGYYTEQRIRALAIGLLVDAPLPGP